jgi:hypothetical protein
MKLTCTDPRLTRDEINNNYIVSVSAWLNNLEKQKLYELSKSGKALDVEIKVHRNRRSLEANGYLWILCQKLSEKIGGTKEDIYKEAVRKAG